LDLDFAYKPADFVSDGHYRAAGTLFPAFSRNVRLAGVFDDALTPSSGKAHDHDDVPEDNESVKKIDYPKTSFYSQGNDDGDHLTGEHTTQSPELRG